MSQLCIGCERSVTQVQSLFPRPCFSSESGGLGTRLIENVTSIMYAIVLQFHWPSLAARINQESGLCLPDHPFHGHVISAEVVGWE